MLHSVQVVSTVSTLPSSSGIASAEPSMKRIGSVEFCAVRSAMAISRGDGSSPITSRASGP
jgi:hypothetical protein